MKRTFREGIWIVLVTLVLAAGTAFLHPKAPGWFIVRESTRWELPVAKVGEILGGEAKEIFWVDSRKDEAFEKGHLEGALHLNEERWGDQIAENQDRLQEAFGRPVVVYCDGTGCQRSKEIAGRLRELLGFEKVYVLRGDWRKLPPALVEGAR